MNLTARVLVTGQVRLKWEDKALNETDYRVERRTPGKAFQEIRQLRAGSVAFTDADVAVTYTYRVRAGLNGTFSAYSYTGSATRTQ